MDYSKLAEEIFFAKEAADFLGISPQRLNILVKEGKITPLKKTPSGTLFHKNQLVKREEEKEIFKGIFDVEGEDGMFVIDSKVKQEALNFATLMNALKITEKKLETQFDKFNELHSVSTPLTELVNEYSDFFNVNEALLNFEYKKAYHAFSNLKLNDEILKRGTEEYPTLLLETKQAPRFLYLRGKKSLLNEKRTVAIVGSRNASESAQKSTWQLAKRLGTNGMTVISGLAKGIDISAHKSALENGFNTIAVIGTNLNQYYPAENKQKQQEIENKGLVVSQFSPATRTQRWFFPLRNGVMSGLSLATIIMEAGETSGSLKQADYAMSQGRKVLIAKNVFENDKIEWPQKYVDKGAVVVEKPSDVLKELANHHILQSENVLDGEMDDNKAKQIVVEF